MKESYEIINQKIESKQPHQDNQVKIERQHALKLLLEQVVRLRDKYENQQKPRQALNQLIRDIEKDIDLESSDNKNIKIESNIDPLTKFQLAIENEQYALPEEIKRTLLLFIENEQASRQLQAVHSKQLNSEQILGFIKEGQSYAEKAKQQDITIFVGNTGAGKSTLINAIEGCTMTWGRFDSKKNQVIYEEKSLFDVPEIKKLELKDLNSLKQRINIWNEDEGGMGQFHQIIRKFSIEPTQEINQFIEKMIDNRKQNVPSKKTDENLRRVILVDDRNNNKKAITGIGHELKSFTFYPNVVKGEHITYADCPGFNETRSEEIEIANAVNTLQTTAQARSVKIVVLINYDTLQGDRGKGLSDLWGIMTNLLGHKENILQHKDSILIMVSQVPGIKPEKFGNDLESIRSYITEKPELIPFRDRIQICDPLNRRLSEGCLSVSEFREQVISLKPIAHPKNVFQTAMSKATALKLVLFAKESKEEIIKDVQNGKLTDAYQKLNYLMQLTVLKDPGFDKEIESLKVELKQVLRMLVENMLDIPKPEKGKEAYIEQLQQFQAQLSKALNFDRLLGGNLVKDAYFKSCCTLLRQLFKQPVFPKDAIEEQVQNLFALMNHFDRPQWQSQINTLIDEVYYKGNQVAVFGYNKRLAGKLFIKLNQYLSSNQERRYGVLTVEDFKNFAEKLQIKPEVLFKSLVEAGWLTLLDENKPSEAKITISYEALFNPNLKFPDTVKDPSQRQALVELMKNHLLIDGFFTKKFLAPKEGQKPEAIAEQIFKIIQNKDVKEDNYKQHQITELLQECFDHEKADRSLDCLKSLNILNPEQVEKRYKLLDHTQRNFKNLNQSLTHDNPIVPTGSIFMLPTDQVPFGYKACNGEWLPVNTYFALYHVIKDTFGVREVEIEENQKEKQFRLPDYRGSFLRGNKDNRKFSDKQEHNTAMPKKEFTTSNDGNHNHTGNTSSDGNHNHTGNTSSSGDHYHTGNTSNEGDHYHQNYVHRDVCTYNSSGSGKNVGTMIMYYESNNSMSLKEKNLEDFYDQKFNSTREGIHSHNLNINYNGEHRHNLDINSNGNHAHNLNIDSNGKHSHTINGGDEETRPENYPVNFVMKY